GGAGRRGLGCLHGHYAGAQAGAGRRGGAAAARSEAVMAARPGTPTGEAPAREARMAGDARRIAEEQAALRRVAVLVARAAPPEEVFAAVAAEAGRLLHPSHAAVSRYDPDGATSIVGTWSSTGTAAPVPVG